VRGGVWNYLKIKITTRVLRHMTNMRSVLY